MSLLDVNNLSVHFRTPEGTITAVDKLAFSLQAGETLGVVGESGSGKSQTAFAIMGLLAKNGRAKGSVCLSGKEILNISEEQLNKIRYHDISIIFQDPMTSLNPYLKIGEQLTEVLMFHRGESYQKAFQQSLHMLDAVHMPEAKKRMNMYPHECSGGMRQRIMIAMSLLCKPKILIADEPTTALDVTIQAQILNLLQEIKKEFNTAMIMITHDLGVVAGFCDKILVIYAGTLMEYGTTREIFYDPTHPYSESLLKAIPRIDGVQETLTTIAGEPPNLLRLPPGCPFQDRCFRVMEICRHKNLILETFGKNRKRACHWEPKS